MIFVCSPLAAIAVISITFDPSFKLTVVEKSPLRDGETTSPKFLEITTIVASGTDFPEILRVLLLTTLSSFGLIMLKKIAGFGVGVGIVIAIGFILDEGIVLVV